MNKVILLGRLTKDPDIRYTKGDKPIAVARYTLAVNRRFKRENEPEADFVNCIAFGKLGEHAEKYYNKGIKIIVEGRIQTGSYEKDGKKVYTTDIVVENQEFAESKGNNDGNNKKPEINKNETLDDDFNSIPDNVDESQLPFNFNY